MPSWKKIIASGSDASFSSATVDTYVSASSFKGSFTGSLFGTSSQALTASYLVGAAAAAGFPYTGSAQITGSLGVTGSLNVSGTISAQLANVSQPNFVAYNTTTGLFTYANTGSFTATSASYSATASYVNPLRQTVIISGSLTISSSATALSIQGSGSNVFSVDGTSGRLFQVDDSLSGSLFSVNTAAGLPVIEAFSDNTVRIGQFGQKALFVSQSRVGVATETPTTNLDVSGSGRFTNGLSLTGSINSLNGYTGSLFGTASQALTASYVLGGGSGVGFPFTGSAQITGSLGITGSLNVTLGITSSLFGTASQAVSASYAYTASSASTAFSASYAQTSSFANNFTVANTLTAQTLVVSTISSSVVYSSGSNIFGNSTANTQTFTGSVSMTGSLTVNNTLLVTGSVIATSALARSTYINPRLVAAANSDVLVGLDIQPTFTNGAFTSVKNIAARINGIGLIGNAVNSGGRSDVGLSVITSINNSAISVAAPEGSSLHIENENNTNNSYVNLSLRTDNGGSAVYSNISLIKTSAALGSLRIHQQGQQQLALFNSTGNLVLQNGGTFTDAGFRLDVSGSTRITNNLTVSGSTQITGSLGITGSLSINGSLLLGQSTSSLGISTQIVSTNATSSYTSVFYNYTLASGSNARAGQVVAVWNGSAIQYMDNSTTDIGNTALVALTASLSAGNVLLTTVLPTAGWTVKTLVNLL